MNEHVGHGGELTAEPIEDAVRRILLRLAGTAPAHWTALHLDFRGGPVFQHAEGHWTLPDGTRRTMVPDTADLYALATAIGALRGWPRTRLDLHHRAAGPYTLTATRDTTLTQPSRGGHGVVLDPDLYLPAPGEDRPDSTAPPAGDPDRAAALLRAGVDRRAEILGHRRELPPPATPEEIARTEELLGFPLPADLRALYLVADGSGGVMDPIDVFDGVRLLPLAELPGAHEHLAYAAVPFDWDSPDEAMVQDEAGPLDTVRRRHHHPAWLPFATADSGNYYAVDLAPAGAGRPGQVIEVGGDYYEGPLYRTDSVTTLLARCLDLLDRGCYEIDEHNDPPSLDITEYAGEPDGPDTFLRAETAPDPAPGTLLHAHLTGPAPVLAPLAAVPRLRRVTLAARPVDGLGALRGVALESLAAPVAADDLAPLAGHPHLGVLDLSGDGPVDLAVLRTLPALWWLDLSRCRSHDLSVLGELTSLRHLALTAAQWEALPVPPPGLLSARLADREVTAEQAAAWAARLGLVPGEPCRVNGRTGDGS